MRIDPVRLEIEGDRIKLRKLRLSDVGSLCEHVNDREVTRWTLNIPYPYSTTAGVRFVRHTRYSIRKGKGYALGIVLKDTNKVIGVVDLFGVDVKNKKAELGYWLGRRYWGRGIMTEAVVLMLEFGFEFLDLHRIYARVFEENVASKRVLEKTGFKLEGKSRHEIYKYGKWWDLLRYSILEGEYRVRKGRKDSRR